MMRIAILVFFFVVATYKADAATTCCGRFDSNVTTTRYNDTCFAIVQEQRSVYSAKLECADKGAYLVLVQSEAINHALTNALQSEGLWKDEKFWIALDDRRVEGVFEWADGSRLSYDHFAYGEGVNSRRGHEYRDCVVMDSTGYWFETHCSYRNGVAYNNFICQWGLQSTNPPTTAETGWSTDGCTNQTGWSTDGYTHQTGETTYGNTDQTGETTYGYTDQTGETTYGYTDQTGETTYGYTDQTGETTYGYTDQTGGV